MIEKVGVIGAGQMGSGIAQVCATAGMKVALTDVSESQLQVAMENIERDLTRQVSRNKLSDQDKEKSLKRITPNTVIESMTGSDLIIEAASETEDVKKAIFKSVSEFTTSDTMLASNTSSISITSLAAVTPHPHKFIGIHFMNPVPVMGFVEIIKGMATSEETFNKAITFIEKLGKSHAISEDYPGFIVNRLLMPMINEACYALYEGVGTIEGIDKGMKLGTNHPMGPLELADFIGLDTCLAIMEVLHEGLNGAKYQPCPLLKNYVEAGWLGRKSGRGFYDYSGEQPVATR